MLAHPRRRHGRSSRDATGRDFISASLRLSTGNVKARRLDGNSAAVVEFDPVGRGSSARVRRSIPGPTAARCRPFLARGVVLDF